jgi:hypothetical protein
MLLVVASVSGLLLLLPIWSVKRGLTLFGVEVANRQQRQALPSS